MLTDAQTAPLTLTVTTFTNGFGDWRARVDFSHALSESDPRPEFSLSAQWARIRRAARNAIVCELATREQTTRESFAAATARVRSSLDRLAVIEQHVYGDNTWHGITLGEHVERSANDWQ